MNEIEKAALDDPFLADALEGYGTTTVNVSSDLAELEKKLEERISDKKVISIAPSGKMFKWWKVAAAAAVLGGAGYFIFQISTSSRDKGVAVTLQEKRSTAPGSTISADSTRLTRKDSTNVTGINKQIETTAKSNPKKGKAIAPELNGEAAKNDLAVEIATPSALDQNDKQPKDSISNAAATTDITAAPMQKKSAYDDNAAAKKIQQPVASNEKLSEGLKKENMQAGLQRVNSFRGRIRDTNNNPLPFANITNTRDNVGTYADAQGRFTLVSPDSVLNVQVRSVGFENNTVQLKNNVASNEVVLQEDKSTPDKVLTIQKPDASRSRMASIKFEELEPADGWGNYNTYLANNLNIPEDIKRRDEVKGQVQLSFEVNQEGDPINIRVEKSLCGKCDEEAIRVVKQGPKWKKKNKKAKRITISVPFDTEQ